MKRSALVFKVASDHLLKALLTSLNRGEQVASQDTMLFGDSLDRLVDESNGDLIEASRYLDALMEVVIRNPRNGNGIARALSGLSRHLDESLRSLGRYRGNEMSRMAQQNQVPMSNLLNQLVRLAHAKPELREYLLPLIQRSAAKKKTYKVARKELLDYLTKEGWTVKPSLKVPWAESPNKRLRLWFKTQAVHASVDSRGQHSFRDARAISYDLDIRTMDPKAVVDLVFRSFPKAR